LTEAEAKTILSDNNFNLEPAIPFVQDEASTVAQAMALFKM
jgi:hypothetical protein